MIPTILKKDFSKFYGLAEILQYDSDAFKSMADAMPMIIYCNQVKDLKPTFANNTTQKLLRKTEREIVRGGFEYVQSISDPRIFDKLLLKLTDELEGMEVGESLVYSQRIKIYDDYQWVITYKKKITQDTYLNIAENTGMLGHIGEMIERLMQPATISKNWENIRRLTESEIGILELLYQGHSSEMIAKDLFISINTVNTHRKNVLKKLEANSTISAIRIYEAFTFLM